jgi:hypothetical protein
MRGAVNPNTARYRVDHISTGIPTSPYRNFFRTAFVTGDVERNSCKANFYMPWLSGLGHLLVDALCCKPEGRVFESR